MYKIHLLILLTAFVGVAVPDIIEKTDCTLRNGEPGECRLIYNCPETLKYLHRFGYRRQAVRCGFDDTTEIVCCKKDDTPKTREEDPPILFSDDNDGYYPYFSTTRKPSRRSTTRRQTWRTTETTTTELPFTFSDGERRCVTACNQYKNTRGQSVETHILYGEEVSPGDLPHMAALGYMKETGISFDCGGSLISNEYVLTAAHCISTVENIPPTIVRLGTVTLNGTFDTTDTDYVIQNITIHPGYDRLKKHEDIALIRLDRKVNLNKVIFPACLDTEGVDPISPMFIAGWGLTENETRSNILLEARVKSVPIEECTGYYVNGRSFRKHYPNGLLPSQMCAKDENNRADSCQGDSGGPLYSKLEDVEAMYKIFGITSFGGKCGVNPGVYTRVSNYLDWIENEVWP